MTSTPPSPRRLNYMTPTGAEAIDKGLATLERRLLDLPDVRTGVVASTAVTPRGTQFTRAIGDTGSFMARLVHQVTPDLHPDAVPMSALLRNTVDGWTGSLSVRLGFEQFVSPRPPHELRAAVGITAVYSLLSNDYEGVDATIGLPVGATVATRRELASYFDLVHAMGTDGVLPNEVFAEFARLAGRSLPPEALSVHANTHLPGQTQA
jgi:hypothetical protein